MARRGRPPGGDSEVTRASIVDAARHVFAERGFAATTVAALADAAGLAPSAIYHYFGGKAELYEAVFDSTADAIWRGLSVVDGSAYTSVLDAVDELLDASARFVPEQRVYHDFLAMVPMEARLHPEFAHLLDRRSKYQDDTFGALADLGIATGEFAGIDRSVALEMIRSAIMGSFFERHFRPVIGSESVEATKELFRRIVS